MSDPRATPIAHLGPRAGPGVFFAVAALAVAVLTALELVVAGVSADRAARIGALVALLFAKVALVMTLFMRVGAYRRWAGLTLVAIAAAVGFAIVLMLDAAVRAGVG